MIKSASIKNTFLLGLLCFSSMLYAGGPWPQIQNGAYIKISEWWVISNQHFTDSGKLDPNLTNGIFNSSIYAEYGITNKLSATVYFPFLSRAYFNNTISGTTGELIAKGEAINSLGDTDLGITYGLLKGPVALSASLTLGIPLGNDFGGSQGNLQTGDGEFNQMISLHAGSGFQLGKVSAYASVYGGYNNRTEGYSDEIRFGAEAGITVWNNKLTVIARLSSIQSRYNGIVGLRENSSSIFANNTEFLSFSPEIGYAITNNWGVSAGIGTALSGKLIYAAPSYNVGVFFKLKPKKKTDNKRYN